MAKTPSDKPRELGNLTTSDAIDLRRLAMELLNYDPETGLFTWKVDRRAGNGAKRFPSGTVAGNLDPGGYIKLWLNSKHQYAHRIAWLYVHGVLPSGHIDHINGNKSDNRLCNLRDCKPSENAANARLSARNTSGFKGVTWHKGAKKWSAQIKIPGERGYLGLFETPEQAHEAYKAAALRLRGQFARV